MPMSNNKLKNLARDFMPARYQPPVKYLYHWLKSSLEPEMKILDQLVKKNDHVIDVGGNRGIYAYRFWKLGAKVEVFEPNLNCAPVLASWAKGKKNINVHPVALSNHSGTTCLHVPVDESGIQHDASGSIETNRSASVHDQEVELRVLDSYHFEGVNFIKIDVEGHESSVIEGAKQTIMSTKPSLLVEIEQRHNGTPILEVFNRILSFGYEGYFLQNGKLVSIDNFLLERDQSTQNMGSTAQRYINNFIFIDKNKIGDIQGLI